MTQQINHPAPVTPRERNRGRSSLGFYGGKGGGGFETRLICNLRFLSGPAHKYVPLNIITYNCLTIGQALGSSSIFFGSTDFRNYIR